MKFNKKAAEVNVGCLIREIGIDDDMDFLADFHILDVDDLLIATARIGEIAGKLRGVNEQLRGIYVEDE